jgi:hypothetical protein
VDERRRPDPIIREARASGALLLATLAVLVLGLLGQLAFLR